MIEGLLLFIIVALTAMILQFFDTSVGMGFGGMVAVLILLGFAPLISIPAVLISSAILSLGAGYFHHSFKNISFNGNRGDHNRKILAVLMSFGILSVVLGAFIANSIPETALKVYIGILVIAIGIVILIERKKKLGFSWPRLVALGSVASFNKGISGGGFGPVLAGGQVVSGVDGRRAVSMTAIVEGVISTIGSLTYIFIEGIGGINWVLVAALIIGGMISTPIAARLVRDSSPKHLRLSMAIVSIILGVLLISKIYF